MSGPTPYWQKFSGCPACGAAPGTRCLDRRYTTRISAGMFANKAHPGRPVTS